MSLKRCYGKLPNLRHIILCGFVFFFNSLNMNDVKNGSPLKGERRRAASSSFALLQVVHLTDWWKGEAAGVAGGRPDWRAEREGGGGGALHNSWAIWR